MEDGEGGVGRTDQLADEESQADADRGEVGRLVLDDGQHDDDQDELGREEHLDEEALRDGGPAAQTRSAVQRAWEESADNASGSDAGYQLRREDHQAAKSGHATGHA